MRLMICAAFAGAFMGAAGPALAELITVATVNNSDMIIMQRSRRKWEQRTGNKINWVVLEENVLRQRVTTDIATNGGQFDVLTIGSYETPIWGKQGWLAPLDDLPASYDIGRHLPGRARRALDRRPRCMRVPFYAESSFTYLPQGPVRQGRAEDAGAAHAMTRSPSSPTSSPTRRTSSSTASACAASRAGARTWPSSTPW